MDHTNRVTGNDNSGVQAVITLGGRFYDSATFSIPTGTSNVSVKTLTPTSGNIFNNIKRAYFLEITADQDLTLRLNADDNDPITIESSDFPWRDSHIEVTDIFVTNASGTLTTLRILAF